MSSAVVTVGLVAVADAAVVAATGAVVAATGAAVAAVPTGGFADADNLPISIVPDEAAAGAAAAGVAATEVAPACPCPLPLINHRNPRYPAVATPAVAAAPTPAATAVSLVDVVCATSLVPTGILLLSNPCPLASSAFLSAAVLAASSFAFFSSEACCGI